MTLVILAAGMGSRYGGLKQIDPITESGSFIIDFSVYDAILCGFDKVVFVINEENLEIFRETIGKRFEDKVRVEYAFQDLNDLPEGFSLPEGRTKPWGTAHALLAARSKVTDPFAVINADDFYGRGAYKLLAEHLSGAADAKRPSFCMVGYRLRNTLTENGTVSRGVCKVNRCRRLVDVVERTKIYKDGEKAFFEEDGASTELAMDTVVSMNCWGFTPAIFDSIEEGFKTFLAQPTDNPMKREYYLPFAVKEAMDAGKCTVTVYSTEDSWYGVTYKEDKEPVKASIAKLISDGVYPEKL
ncbi:MAG: nucleotidyltransferase [Clostridia bacterium]|nr:nucleotidyltransferase [Clostridia bacterium]